MNSSDVVFEASVLTANHPSRGGARKVLVVAAEQGRQPALNKPVVLSPEGKKVAPTEEKAFLQK